MGTREVADVLSHAKFNPNAPGGKGMVLTAFELTEDFESMVLRFVDAKEERQMALDAYYEAKRLGVDTIYIRQYVVMRHPNRRRKED